MSEKIIPISPRQIRNRRIKVFGLTGLSTLLATLKWMTVIPSDASLLTAFLMIVLFMLTFGWIALFFWSSIFGFTELLRGRKIPGIIWPDPNRQPVSRTAILMPVYNESPQSVFANLLAMAKSLEKTGQQKFYDIFVLSDTTNPKVWIEEEETWMKMRQMMPADMNMYYRRRPINVARKSGNIEDFCQKWGAFYDFMIVLDADSLLTGQTMLTMTLLMETNKQTGIIQAPPMCINR
ncbi:MAG: glycosyltransferase, partial [Alphaproteobacteria bacterium]|nr:glycosyltransferase [Alphaproteobacteria bacterium]